MSAPCCRPLALARVGPDPAGLSGADQRLEPVALAGELSQYLLQRRNGLGPIAAAIVHQDDSSRSGASDCRRHDLVHPGTRARGRNTASALRTAVIEVQKPVERKRMLLTIRVEAAGYLLQTTPPWHSSGGAFGSIRAMQSSERMQASSPTFGH